MDATQNRDATGIPPDDRPLFDQILKACRSAFLTIGIFSFCINLLVLAVPVYMVQVFDRVMTSRSGDTLFALTLAALMALGIMATLDVIRSRLLVRIGLWLDQTLSGRLFMAGIKLDGKGGRPALQNVRDLAQVRNFLTGGGVFALLDAPWVPLFMAVIFLLHPDLGSIAVAGAVALFGLAYLNEVLTRSRLARAGDASRGALAAADTMARQAETASALGMGRILGDWWSARNARALHLQADASDRAGVIIALSKSLRLALQIVIIAVAAMLVIQGDLTAGAMIAASIIFGRAMAPVEQSIGGWRNLVSARAAYRRIRDALRAAEGEARRMPLPRPQGNFSVTGLAFAPEGGDNPVFSDLAFDIEPGELLGITGPSGAGKSSLVRMLLGVARPSRGRVRLDGADVFDWQAEDLGRHVGYVPQIVELLPGTIRENIARFTEARPEQVVEAAKAAGVHTLVLSLPHGYDTLVGGVHDILSVGARQRIALARALFGDPQVLILDEPYSNLDAEGVTALVAALERLKARGATVVIVAHRPSILAHADRVLLLQGGSARIVGKQQRRAKFRVLNSDGEAEPATVGDSGTDETAADGPRAKGAAK